MSDLITKLEIEHLRQMSYEEINDTLKKLKGKVDTLQEQLKQQWVSVDDVNINEDVKYNVLDDQGNVSIAKGIVIINQNKMNEDSNFIRLHYTHVINAPKPLAK